MYIDIDCRKTEPDPSCHTQHLRSLRSQKTMSSRPTQFASETGVELQAFACVLTGATRNPLPTPPFLYRNSTTLDTLQRGDADTGGSLSYSKLCLYKIFVPSNAFVSEPIIIYCPPHL